MSIITRIKNAFSKVKSTDLIGVALRQQSISYFVRKTDESKGEVFENKGNAIAKALKALVSEEPLSGHVRTMSLSVSTRSFANCTSR
jgi:MSHA biogenesis protein MshI